SRQEAEVLTGMKAQGHTSQYRWSCKVAMAQARHPIETMQHTNVIRRSTSFQIQCLSCSRMAAREAAEKTIVTPVLFSAVGGSIRDEK
ncbi:hypothetical protein LTR66_017192, partial [Elasticomyces elasticus]